MAETIQADMGANVWKILVKQGDRVENEEPLMILEAMKMEIPILAEESGTVVALRVAEGDSVAPGQALVDFETE
ncbi:biotin/lipoyl-binding carrier protein [Saccharopolyspora shandongensis]|uniref:Acetyl-CoA carboxylase biotin carboxyl carrier protein n=1 Tax=Saccharopolyspora shandongensis TaxID=418495 RepID=A0A1H3HN84_9PSEU|nr:biotin/lipoyl-binding carrier protein [Saccharopolyspora shandongensis]SDY16937.1 acetyl-CoA carboxylase biotin carboxyl carrier protein [Saccharopolyspora shandongensis]